jgi:hypothetical protein
MLLRCCGRIGGMAQVVELFPTFMRPCAQFPVPEKERKGKGVRWREREMKRGKKTYIY